ncbi:hypothetical protein FKP32DRAFT_1679217 [Trametes sanguinea]|nr:hypothetical protein FKP32DRAFT_1679217 [Trametes sanguinea]
MSGEASSPLSNFHFTTIGKEPRLLQRISASEDGGQPQNPPSPSPSPVSSPRVSTLSVPPPTSRKSLLEDLAGIEEPMPVNTRREEPTSGAPSATRPSGTRTAVGTTGQPGSASNGQTTSPNPSGFLPSTSHTSVTGMLGSSHPSGSKITIAGFNPLLTPHASQSPEQGPVGQDDGLDVFRHALQRLQMESDKYAERERQTREAIALQQEQAALWRARADTLLESMVAAFAQCERRMAAASHAVEEADRLRNLVRQYEEKETDYRRQLDTLRLENGRLERTKVFDEREARVRVEELTRAMEQTNAEKAQLLADLETVKLAAERSAQEREQLLAQLEEQKRMAAQEKAELLEQLHEAKRAADVDRQRRKAGLELLEEQLRAQLDAHRARGDIEEGRRQGDPPRSDGHEAEAGSPAGLPPRPAIPSRVDQKPTAGAASHQDLKPLNIPQTTSHSVLHTSPVHSLPVKPEFSTPALSSVASTHKRGPPPSTPTVSRLKPEPNTVQRDSGLSATCVSQAQGGHQSTTIVKPEELTPLIERQLRPTEADEVEVEAALRRGQSLDYHPSVPQTTGRTPPPLPQHGARMPSSTAQDPAATFAPLHHDQADSRYPPGLEANARASELSAFPPQHSMPNLTYPSRSPSEDADGGLGQSDARSRGPSQAAGQSLRSHTPPLRSGPARRGRSRGKNQRATSRNSPPPSRSVDHWSPTPGRPPLYREPLPSPERPKRPRDEEYSPEGSVPRRRRVDSNVGEPSYSAVPLPPRPPAAFERGPSPYSRSPSPGRSNAERFYHAQRSQYTPPSPPRRRSPTPPPAPPSTFANDPYSYGYAPPPEVGRRETDVRFPQVVAAPVPVPAGGPVRSANATPRPRKSAAPSPASSAHAARGAPGGPSPLRAPEVAGEITLLRRMEPDTVGGTRHAKTTPAKVTRGGGPNGGPNGGPKNATRGRRGGANPSARNGNPSQNTNPPSLLTRITTQASPANPQNEKASLASRIA